jgi:hypothetical protein
VACEGCPTYKALELAEQVVADNPGNAFDRLTQRAKVAELAVVRIVLEKAAVDCEGKGGDGGNGHCGKSALINDTLQMVFQKPGMPVSDEETLPEVGFNNTNSNLEG